MQNIQELHTQPVSQLHAKDMFAVENMAATSLPSSTNDEYQKGAAKYSQLGVTAWSEVLTALLDGVALGTRNALLIVDISLHWPDTFLAFQRLQQTYKVPLFFHGFLPPEEHSEWLQAAVMEKTA